MILQFFGIGLLIIFIFFILGIHRVDCYDMHVVECNDCHKSGLGFLVCSGFCSNVTTDSPCYIPLEKKCEDNIAHGCNVASNERINGWCIPLTNICWLD